MKPAPNLVTVLTRCISQTRLAEFASIFRGFYIDDIPQYQGYAPERRRVVCAAGRKVNGTIVCSPRHGDFIWHSVILETDWVKLEQGFVDQKGVFMTREEAWKVAEAAGQIIYRCGGDGEKLFSENLY